MRGKFEIRNQKSETGRDRRPISAVIALLARQILRISVLEFRIFLLLPLLALAGCQKSETPTAPENAASPTPSPTPGSASFTPNSFSDVTAQLDPGGDLYLYLSTAQWTSKLAQGIDTLQSMTARQTPEQQQQVAPYLALLKDIIQKSGVQAVSGVGASSINYAAGLYRNKIFVHHYPADGSGVIWSLYGTQPHPLASLDYLPVDTGLAGFADFDLAKFIGFLRDEATQSGIPPLQQAVAQWQTELTGLTGLKLDDVLASFNGAVGMVLTLDASNNVTIPIENQSLTIPFPRLALLFAVKNDLIFKTVDKMFAGTPGFATFVDPDVQMRLVQVPLANGVNLRPTLAQWNGFLVFATDDNLIRAMIAAQKGGPGFKTTAEYATLSAGLPEQGNSFVIATQHFADTVRKIETQVGASQPGGGARTALMERFEKTGHFMSVGAVLPNGWLSISQGSQGAGQLLAPAIAIPAMAAGMALPALNAYRRGAAPPGPPPIPPPVTSFPSGNPPSPAASPGTSP